MRELKKGILPEGTEMGSIGGVDVKQFASKDGTAIQLTGSKGYVQLSREDAAKLAARLAKWAGSKTSAQPGEYESVQESDCGCGPDCACGGNCGPDCNCQNCGESTTEAVGSFADPIYDLIEELGSHSIVLDELIRYLDGDTIKDFVSDFRRHNDMPEMKDDADESVTEAEGHKVINHNKPVDLAGNSIWQGEKRGEPVTTSVNVGKITINTDEDGYMSVSVEHDGPWTIYTDSGFEDAISAIIGHEVGFSEQGMQDDGVAHLEGDEPNESIKRKERTMEEIDRILQIAGIQKAPVAEEKDSVEEGKKPYPGEYDYTDEKYMDADGTPKSDDDDDDDKKDKKESVEEAKKELEEEPNEGNEFSGELAKAKKAGKKEFEVDGKKYKVEESESVNELNVSNDKEKVKAQIEKLMKMAKDARDAGDSNKAYNIERSSEMAALQKKLSKLGESEEEVVAEAPTMDTTQLINLLKNSGISEEQINKKLDEWANTPAGVGEVEPTVHAGDANDDFAQAVNLSLKRYLDAQDMKVNVTESHTKEKLSNAYKDFKAK